MIWKICTKCKTSKPLYLYNAHKGGKFGHCSYCKVCNRAKVQLYRERLREAKMGLKIDLGKAG